MKPLAFALATIAALTIGSADAQDAGLPPLLEAAIADAEAHVLEAPALAFTRTVEHEDLGRVSLRFDSSAGDGARWTIAYPDADAQTDDHRDLLREAREEDDPAASVLIDEPRHLVGDSAERVREDAGVAYFAVATPPVMANDEPVDSAMLAAISAEVGVDVASGRLASFRMFANDSFKPNVAVRIDRFDMMMTFAEAWPDGPLAVARMEQDIAGRALFRGFVERVIVNNTDIVVQGANDALGVQGGSR